MVQLENDQMKEMDRRIFKQELLNLKLNFIDIPLTESILYKKELHILFLNFSGIKLKTHDDVKATLQAVEAQLKLISKPGLFIPFSS
jgi:hypothetical protein